VLLVASVVCSSLVVAGLLHLLLEVKGLLSTLLLCAMAVLVGSAVRAAGMSRCGAKRLSAPR
jgi:hypothetical protein